MARTIKPKEELYGEYPELTENQKKYVIIATDPRIKLQKLKEEDLAAELGLNKKSLYLYRQNEKVREAIVKETMLKSADNLSDILTLHLNIIKGKNTPEGARIKAINLFYELYGLIDKAKKKGADTRKELKSTGEQKLRELADRFRGTLVQPPE